METVSRYVLVALVVTCAISDLRSRRIPNYLTVPGFLLALGLRFAAGGVEGLVEGVYGAGLALVVMLPLFAAGAFGGGDSKMLLAVGAFLGPGRLVSAVLIMGVAGGVLALGVVLRRRIVLPVLFNTGGLVRYVVTLGRTGERPTLGAGAVTVPYGVAIAIGALGAMVL